MPRRADDIRPYGLDAVFRLPEKIPESSVFQMKLAWNSRLSGGISRPMIMGLYFYRGNAVRLETAFFPAVVRIPAPAG